jgi:hypothetical protein
MNMKIHQTIQKFFALAAIALSFGFAHAQTFPEHPIVLASEKALLKPGLA